jgi:hypothetical protein
LSRARRDGRCGSRGAHGGESRRRRALGDDHRGIAHIRQHRRAAKGHVALPGRGHIKSQRRCSRDSTGGEGHRCERKGSAGKARKRPGGVIDSSRPVVERVPDRHRQCVPGSDGHDLQDGRVEIDVRRRAIHRLAPGLHHDGHVEILAHCGHGGWRVYRKYDRRRRRRHAGRKRGGLNRQRSASLRAGGRVQDQRTERGGKAAKKPRQSHATSLLAMALARSRASRRSRVRTCEVFPSPRAHCVTQSAQTAYASPPESSSPRSEPWALPVALPANWVCSCLALQARR